MKLLYHNQEIDMTYTHNPLILKYRAMKLYHAFYLIGYNRYSSIKNRYRIDAILVDDNNTIVTYQQDMHINTVCSHEEAKNIILTPSGYVKDLKVGEQLLIQE